MYEVVWIMVAQPKYLSLPSFLEQMYGPGKCSSNERMAFSQIFFTTLPHTKVRESEGNEGNFYAKKLFHAQNVRRNRKQRKEILVAPASIKTVCPYAAAAAVHIGNFHRPLRQTCLAPVRFLQCCVSTCATEAAKPCNGGCQTMQRRLPNHVTEAAKPSLQFSSSISNAPYKRQSAKAGLCS
jgi:hypothetical protein